MSDEPESSATTTEPSRFFQRVDWASFGVTTLLALLVYLLTLSPEVGLGWSGFFSTAAMYPGVSIPPGYPLWAIYGWLFIKLLPFSNVAWRLAVGSAVAGALACGMIALMVSRVGVLAAENVSRFKNLLPNEEKSVRVVCGCVAGLGFGFDGCFWRKAVIPDPQSLGLLFFTLTLCFLTRWFFAPHQKRYLYAAAFSYGLTLDNSLSLVAAAFGLPFLLALGDRKLGRDVFFGVGIFSWGILTTNGCLLWTDIKVPSVHHLFLLLCVIFSFTWLVLLVRTRGSFSELKAVFFCATLLFVSLSAYLLLPIFSMTTPPMNWGYPRTVEGFFHVLSRGQFESLNPTISFSQLMKQLEIYGKIAADEFGVVYLMAAAIPFCLLHKISSPARKWLVGLLAVWIFVSWLTLLGLNPSSDKSSVEVIKPFFTASHLILAILAGCGLTLVSAFFAQPTAKPTPVATAV